MEHSFKKNLDLPVILLMLSVLLIGAFPSYVSCLLTAVSVVCLIVIWKGGTIRIRWNLTTVTVWVLVFFYLISTLWAVDPGEAFIGFMKYLPVGLLPLIISQREQTKVKYFAVLPYYAAALTVISAILMQISTLKPYFAVSGRLAGFFQYPNTFACFLLIAELLICTKLITKKETGRSLIIDIIVLAILIAGLIYSGSRTVLILAFLADLVLILYLVNKKARLITVIIAVLIVAIAIYLIKQDGQGISFAGTTLADRLLYYADALPVILKHPFGMGHLGYYFTQGSFQTGVYSTMFVHNGFLQVFLDVGWIPGVLLIAAVVKSVISKTLTVPEKILLCTFAVHIFFDFDLQFICMFMILILMLDNSEGKKAAGKASAQGKAAVKGKKTASGKAAVQGKTAGKAAMQGKTAAQDKTSDPGKIIAEVILVILALGSLYMGTHLLLSAIHANREAESLYPWNTENQLEILKSTTDTEEIGEIAKSILDYNPSASMVWDSMAKFYYSQGDFGEVINCESKALQLGQFAHDHYEDYMQMLLTGIRLYQQAGDESSAGICRDTLLNVYDRFMSQEERLSGLGRILKDQPDLTLSSELTEAIKALQ